MSSASNVAPAADLRVLFADDWILAIDKPARLLVHRSALDAHETDDVLGRLARSGLGRWHPAHRLDKGTSGVLLLTRDPATAAALGQAWAAGTVHKTYRALVRGWPTAQGQTDRPLARDPERPSTGQPMLPACTRWRVLQELTWPVRTHPEHAHTRVAVVAVWPLTGRRHQIRRHFKQLGHPLVGDATHGKGPLNRALAAWLGIERLWLHAQRLELPHPVTGQALTIESPLDGAWHAPALGGPLTQTSAACPEVGAP
jgi:tRNA pseudouridine65 synthase